jgi:hypothetical protein
MSPKYSVVCSSSVTKLLFVTIQTLGFVMACPCHQGVSEVETSAFRVSSQRLPRAYDFGADPSTTVRVTDVGV